ncbi:uncharacterized protein LOC135108397 [Scylla paramamosain]|uniref:uncharacterized protein LOC135108397 n=1 Tax=Scylla paramamosain TaxID=85552 RepID=UPI003082FB14
MASIEGNIRFNAVVYKDNSGFRYLRNVARNNKLYLRCIHHPNCGGRAVLSETTGVIRATQGHNHESSDYAATDLRNTLKMKAAEDVGLYQQLRDLQAGNKTSPTWSRCVFLICRAKHASSQAPNSTEATTHCRGVRQHSRKLRGPGL